MSLRDGDKPGRPLPSDPGAGIEPGNTGDAGDAVEPEKFSPEDRIRMQGLLQIPAGKMYRDVVVPRIELAEICYLLSRIPQWQRKLKQAGVAKILNELRRGTWCSYNGDTIVIFRDMEGQLWVIDGHHRLIALYLFLMEGGTAPADLKFYVTKATDAYKTLDQGIIRTPEDLEAMGKLVHLAGNVRAGILYEALDFKPTAGLSNQAKIDLAHRDHAALAFAVSLPQSGGGGTDWHSLSGVYAAALRLLKSGRPEDEVHQFIPALIRNEQFIGDQKVEQLGVAQTALRAYARGSSEGKVMAATVTFRAYLAWEQGEKISKRDLEPPGRAKVWPSSMERPVPVELPKVIKPTAGTKKK